MSLPKTKLEFMQEDQAPLHRIERKHPPTNTFPFIPMPSGRRCKLHAAKNVAMEYCAHCCRANAHTHTTLEQTSKDEHRVSEAISACEKRKQLHVALRLLSALQVQLHS